MLNEKKLLAQIKLLEDPDESVYKTVQKNLFEHGMSVIPELEKAWENSPDEFIQVRIEYTINKILFNDLSEKLSEWSNKGAKDILYGAFLIARHQYPALQWGDIEAPVNSIKHEIWIEINNELTALEKIKVINHVLFRNHNFSPNDTNYYSPGNSYINTLLETKKGNSESLGILYMAITQRLGLPVYGVNLPKNYILCYVDSLSTFEAFGDSVDNSVLFYINPFNNGAVFGRKEVDLYIKQQELEPCKEYYSHCTNRKTLVRLIEVLIDSCKRAGTTDKIKGLKKMIEIIGEG